MSVLTYIVEGLSVTREPNNYKYVYWRQAKFTIPVDGDNIEYTVRFNRSCKNKMLDVTFDRSSENFEDKPKLTNHGKPFDVFNGVGYSVIKQLEHKDYQSVIDDCPIYILSFLPAEEDKDIETDTNRRQNIYMHILKRISTYFNNPIVDTRISGKRVNVEFKYPLNGPSH